MAKGALIFGGGLAALLLLSRRASAHKGRAMPDRIHDLSLSGHFKLSEFLRSRSVPALASYVPSTAEIANLRILATEVLEPVRLKIGVPMFVTSGLRPESIRDPQGRTFFEALKAAGYQPSATSAHINGSGADVSFSESTPTEKWIAAYQWAKTLPKAGQVILYWKSGVDGARPSHLHLAAVTPSQPKVPPADFAFMKLDGKRVGDMS